MRQRTMAGRTPSGSRGRGSRRRWSRPALIVVVGIAVVLIPGIRAGAAFAFWHTMGTGSAVGSTGTAAAVTVQAVGSGTVSSPLIPGGSADLLVQLNNPNSNPVTIVGIAPNGSRTAQIVGGNGCTAANSGVSVPVQAGLSIAVATGTQVVHIPTGAAMTTGSANGCQGAAFQLPVTLTVQK